MEGCGMRVLATYKNWWENVWHDTYDPCTTRDDEMHATHAQRLMGRNDHGLRRLDDQDCANDARASHPMRPRRRATPQPDASAEGLP